MKKRDSLYNYGMLPLVYSVKQAKKEAKGWQRCGIDVCYYQGLERYEKRAKSKKGKKKNNRKRKERPYFILTFTVDLSRFDDDDELFFAHSIPYTYTFLQRYLATVEARCKHCKLRTLCKTLSGNLCNLLTITTASEDPEELKGRVSLGGKGISIIRRVRVGGKW